MKTFFKNLLLPAGKYRHAADAVIISCFFNPQKSPYRLKAFNLFYERIKHLNHRIIECVIGDVEPQLQESENISRVYTDTLLWHKEALLNKIIGELPHSIKYVFWIDADVLFTNANWLVDATAQLKAGCAIVQPFETCFHLEKGETAPSYHTRMQAANVNRRIPNNERRVWKSFCSNHATNAILANSHEYNQHGHVGFAWGARKDILLACPLYDRALIGGADHIIAHAAAGQIPHACIAKSFTEDIDAVNSWSRRFFAHVQARIGYCAGDLYHIWHGDIDKRQYLKRIQEFTPTTKLITKRDKNGLYFTQSGDDRYIRRYFAHREVGTDDSFLASLAVGYLANSTLAGTAIGGNVLGAMIGDALNDNEKPADAVEFGGGDFGGAGAGSDWSKPGNDEQAFS